ncbi:hypothetical protein GALL_511330 [mine drainage metagenome]|uniref:Uncharacterized protein n=1 Tax=mine drainage metagenome TaxID=410659 RepID=A0A1J5P7V7_9ZZZZ
MEGFDRQNMAVIPVGDVERTLVGSEGQPDRRSAQVNVLDDAILPVVYDRNGMAFDVRDIGLLLAIGDGDPHGTMTNRDRGLDFVRRQVDYRDTVAALVGDVGVGLGMRGSTPGMEHDGNAGEPKQAGRCEGHGWKNAQHA